MTKKQKNRLALKNLILLLTYPDYIKISMRITPKISSQKKEPSLGRFNEHNHCYLQPRNPRAGKVMRKHRYDIVIKTLSIRTQQILKDIVLKELKLAQMPRVVWQQGNNCLSPLIYKRISKNQSLSMKLKKKLYQKLNTMVKLSVLELTTDYYKQFGVNIDEARVQIFLNKVEICTDWLGTKNMELSKDKTFIRKFQQVIHNQEGSYFLNGHKYAIPNEVKPGCMSFEGSKSRKMLKGFLGDRRTIKLYLKCLDSQGSTNRLETNYNKFALKASLKNKQLDIFSSKPIKLSTLLKVLSRQHRSFIFKIINHMPFSRKPNFKKKVQLGLSDLCGKYSDEMKKQFEKWGELSTSRNSPLSSGAKRRLRLICSKNLLFERTGTARYSISKQWLNENYT